MVHRVHLKQDDRFCLLVIIGVIEHERNKLVAVEDAYKESEVELD
ncbi:MAG: hypothetical protein ACTS73_04545 [Arsenophonus sp. NEOnobi-MAG3]